jgi:hypothetical protein
METISNFKFVFICVILHNILSEINYSSKILQQKNTDLETSSNFLEQIKNKLKNIRAKYEFFKTESSSLFSKTGIYPLNLPQNVIMQ